jgi:hypothetical protein
MQPMPPRTTVIVDRVLSSDLVKVADALLGQVLLEAAAEQVAAAVGGGLGAPSLAQDHRLDGVFERHLRPRPADRRARRQGLAGTAAPAQRVVPRLVGHPDLLPQQNA